MMSIDQNLTQLFGVMGSIVSVVAFLPYGLAIWRGTGILRCDACAIGVESRNFGCAAPPVRWLGRLLRYGL